MAGGPYLSPGECQWVDIWATAPGGPPTAWHLIATVDAQNFVAEGDELNNSHVKGPVGVGAGPDLVVSGLTTPLVASGSFSVEVTVCNRGTQGSGSFDVTFNGSPDTTIDTSSSPNPDPMLGATWVMGLMPGECRTEAASLWAGAPGENYVGVVLDEFGTQNDLVASNNTFLGPIMGFGTGPELVVEALEAPPSADGPFVAPVTVCNRGNAPSSGTDVSLYASVDATLEVPPAPTADYPLGMVGVPSLQPGECRTEPANIFAGPIGAYWVIAVVDPWNSVMELIESNNILVGGLIGLGSGPDLVVTAIDAPPSAQGQFDVRVTACNQGTAPSSSFGASVYASQDDVITPMVPLPGGDLPVAWAQFQALMPGQCKTELTSASAFAQGAFYLGAVADESDGVPELIESNNTFVGQLIGFGSGPDLVVSALLAPPSASGSFVVEVTACNQGTMASWSTDVTLYLSQDANIVPPAFPGPYTDQPAGWVGLPGLQPGQCETLSTSAFAGPQGAYYLGAVVDEFDNIPELIEVNNVFVGAQIGLGFGPDLVVTAVSGPPSAQGQFEVRVTTCNQGTTSSGGGDVALYLSADQTITSAYGQPFFVDFPVGLSFVPGLQPGQCHTGLTSVWSAPGQGAFYLGAIVDEGNFEMELLEGNNVFVGGLIGIGWGPDLVVTGLNAPPSVNGPFAASVTVCNQGTGPSNSFSAEIVASEDTVNTQPFGQPYFTDYPVASLWFAGLSPGECRTESTSASAPPWGAMYLGAYVDGSNSEIELIESNNAWLGNLTGFGSGPDLIVSSITAPPSANGPISVLLTACNQGTAPSSWTEVTVYSSEDTTITPQFNLPYPGPDLILGQVSFPGIAAGQCDTQALMVNLGPQGPLYLGAVIDEFESVLELIESNNRFVGELIGVGFGPDLVAGTVALPPFVTPGGAVNVAVEVCNQGTDASGAVDAALVASSDGVLVATGPNSDFMLGMVWVPGLAPGACHLSTVTGWVPPSEAAYQVGLVIDPFDGIPELIETNNAEVAGILEVAYVFCGNGVIDGPEWCDDGNFSSGDGCDSQCRVEQAPWQQLASGNQSLNIGWNYAMGYHFTPLADGTVNGLGGVFNGTKTVRLFERATGLLLAEAQVVGNNSWSYAAISGVPVVAGQGYTVAVYLAGSGGSYRRNVGSYPKYDQDVRIDATTYAYTASNPTARPTNQYTGSLMYGQADIRFVRSGP